MKKIKRIILAIIVILLAIYLGIFVFEVEIDTFRLKNLHYSDEAIEQIKDYNLSKYVLDRKKYSKTLEMALINKQFVAKNLDLYYSIEYQSYPEFIAHINTLTHLGYNKAQLILIFKYLDSNAIKVIVERKPISNIEDYIATSYFKVKNLDRYVNYKEKKKDLDYEEIIIQVNIGLDYPFYQNIMTVTDVNDTDVLVNKYRKLPSTFVPKNLVNVDNTYTPPTLQLAAIARDAFEKLYNDMKKENLTIEGVSGFRSYSYQNTLYNNYVKKDGKQLADTYSARPGHSEHQTGLVIDVKGGGLTSNDFGKTKEYEWINNNAHKYGFIIRYPEGKEAITGYQYEPWHLRYVGIDIATYIFENKITFDEYYIKYLDKEKE